MLIIAERYGTIGTDEAGCKISYTEMEFNYAIARNKPIIALLHRKPEDLPSRYTESTNIGKRRLSQFRQKAECDRMVMYWNTKENLHICVVNSLRKMIKDTTEAIGWVRADFLEGKLRVEYPIDTVKDEVVQSFTDIGDSDQYDRFMQLDYRNKERIMKDKPSLMAIGGFINECRHIEKTRKVIESLPSYYAMDSEHRIFLKEIIDDRALYDRSVKANVPEFFVILFTLFTRLNIFEREYVLKAFEIYKEGSMDTVLCRRCAVFLIEYASTLGHSEVKEQLKEFAMHELINGQTPYVVEDLISIIVRVCQDEEDLEWLLSFFLKLGESVQKRLFESLVEECGPELCIISPKYQRIFMRFCDVVISWNDDRISAIMLIYWLLARTMDVFTVDEVFDKIDSLNDDAFYIFMWNLPMYDVSVRYETSYDLDTEANERICEIIRKRKHPRGAKLIEQYLSAKHKR